MRSYLLPQVILSLSLIVVVGFVQAQECAEQKDKYANCVFRLEPAVMGKECDECRIQTFDRLPDKTQCDELERTLCQAVHNCPGCGNCQDELEEFWHCTTHTANNGTCGIECFTEISPTPTGPLCPLEFDNYRNCIFALGSEEQQSTCDACRLNASAKIPTDVTDCAVVQDIFCDAVHECDCGECAAPLELYLNCDVYKRWFGECKVDCGVAAAAAALAAQQEGDANDGDNSGAGESPRQQQQHMVWWLLLELLIMGVMTMGMGPELLGF